MRIERFIKYKEPSGSHGRITYKTQFTSGDEHHFIISERISEKHREAQLFRCDSFGYITDFDAMVSCKTTEQCIKEFTSWNAFIS
jgi:hypothetical protein